MILPGSNDSMMSCSIPALRGSDEQPIIGACIQNADHQPGICASVAHPHSRPFYRHVVFFAERLPFTLRVLPRFAWRTIFNSPSCMRDRHLTIIMQPSELILRPVFDNSKW